MAHNQIFQTECKVTIDGISYEGEVINFTGEKIFTNNKKNENNQKINEMNDILKNIFHL